KGITQVQLCIGDAGEDATDSGVPGQVAGDLANFSDGVRSWGAADGDVEGEEVVGAVGIGRVAGGAGAEQRQAGVGADEGEFDCCASAAGEVAQPTDQAGSGLCPSAGRGDSGQQCVVGQGLGQNDIGSVAWPLVGNGQRATESVADR